LNEHFTGNIGEATSLEILVKQLHVKRLP